jgi:hypothetical protein
MRLLAAFILSGVALVWNSADAESAKRKPDTATVKPLTYANVVSHFKAAHLNVLEARKGFTAFLESESKNANIDAFCVVMVESTGEGIHVTFYMTDAHEMKCVTEFLDAPFFARAETGKLFDLISSGRNVRGKAIGRFRVDFHRWQAGRLTLAFSFTPMGTRNG